MKSALLFTYAITLSLAQLALGAELSQLHFWEITKNGKSSYLLGTIHTGVSAQELPPEVMAKIDQQPYFFSEIGNNEITAPNKSEYLISKTFNQTDLMKIDGILKQKYPDENFNVKKLTNLQTNLLLAEPQSNNSEKDEAADFTPMDNDLIKYANQKQKKIMALDNQKTTNALMDHLNKSSIAEIKDQLQGTNKSNAEGPSTDKIIEEYYKGKVPCIEDKLILDVRNKEWASKIEKYNSEGGAFVAGGAMHFSCGKPSVIEALKSKGFTIKRLNLADLRNGKVLAAETSTSTSEALN